MGILVLTATKEPNDCFGNAESTVEEICVGHIQAFKGIKERMDEVKQKFNLTDAIEWRTVIAEAGKRKRNQLEGKPKGGENKGNDWKSKKGGDKGKRQQNGGGKKPSNGAPGAKSPAGQKKLPPKKIAQPAAELGDNSTKAKKGNKPTNEKKVPPAVESERPASPVPAKVTTEDSFFITANGASYQSTAVVDRVQPDGPDDGFDRKERRANKFGRPLNKFNNNKTAANKRDTHQDALSGNEHPSWAAKRKQKTIPNFQGKKVKFGEDVGKKAATGSASKTADNNVHPSWAAKQKLKPVISEFKGSKITFD